MILTREAFNNLIETLDLNNRNARKTLLSIVIDEIVEERFIVDWGENPFINYSRAEYLRPCPKLSYSLEGWKMRLVADTWFAD